jgi:hypothetical protein
MLGRRGDLIYIDLDSDADKITSSTQNHCLKQYKSDHLFYLASLSKTI